MTLTYNSQGIPQKLKDSPGREDVSAMCYCDSEKKDVSLLSWTVKNMQFSGWKFVLPLIEYISLSGVTKDGNKKKCGIYKVYDLIDKGRNGYCQPAQWQW